MLLLQLRPNRFKQACFKLDDMIKRRPLCFGLAIPTVNAVIGDLIVQMAMNKPPPRNHASSAYYGFDPSQNNNLMRRLTTVDWNRTAVFATFGFFYQGAAQYLLYAKCFNQLARRIVDPKRVLLSKAVKVSMEQFVHTPFLYFPAFFIIKNKIREPDASMRYTLPSLITLGTCWKFCVPAQWITFSVAGHWRLPWLSSYALLFTMFLSFRCMD